MSEIMDDYDAGFKKGQHDLNRIVALKEDLAYEKGYEKGKEFAQNKVLELMDEVIHEYRTLAKAEKMDSESGRIPHAQLNAVVFMRNWVCSGGHEDEDGNRVCLVW